MNKPKVSVVVCTLNEEKNIERCLRSAGWAFETVVVDNGSTDRTIEIAKKFTDHIFHHDGAGYVEPSRNYAIEKAKGDWVLILDADEEIPSALADKLQIVTQENNGISFLRLPRKNIIFGKWMKHTGWWPDKHIRFFKKGTVIWKNEIHSSPNTEGKGLDIEGEELALIHYNYDSIAQFLHKNLENYARQEAKELLEKGYQFDHMDVIRFPVREFLGRYFAREGYKDGFHGFILSVLMAVYHFAVFAYLWEKMKFIDNSELEIEKGLMDTLKKSKNDFEYWVNKKKIEREKNGLKKIGLRLKNKLK